MYQTTNSNTIALVFAVAAKVLLLFGLVNQSANAETTDLVHDGSFEDAFVNQGTPRNYRDYRGQWSESIWIFNGPPNNLQMHPQSGATGTHYMRPGELNISLTVEIGPDDAPDTFSWFDRAFPSC